MQCHVWHKIIPHYVIILSYICVIKVPPPFLFFWYMTLIFSLQPNACDMVCYVCNLAMNYKMGDVIVYCDYMVYKQHGQGFSDTINTLRPRQNRRHFADDIFKCIFLNENAWITIEISLKFVAKVQLNNIPALIQIMAWRRPGAKPLSEPMVFRALTHICVTRPQWVNNNGDLTHFMLNNSEKNKIVDACSWHWRGTWTWNNSWRKQRTPLSFLVKTMAFRIFSCII